MNDELMRIAKLRKKLSEGEQTEARRARLAALAKYEEATKEELREAEAEKLNERIARAAKMISDTVNADSKAESIYESGTAKVELLKRQIGLGGEYSLRFSNDSEGHWSLSVDADWDHDELAESLAEANEYLIEEANSIADGHWKDPKAVVLENLLPDDDSVLFRRYDKSPRTLRRGGTEYKLVSKYLPRAIAELENGELSFVGFQTGKRIDIAASHDTIYEPVERE